VRLEWLEDSRADIQGLNVEHCEAMGRGYLSEAKRIIDDRHEKTVVLTIASPLPIS
jgi:hypothetical protein